MPPQEQAAETVLGRLRDRAREADGEASWPGESWKCLRDGGVLEWSIPVAYGGRGGRGEELLARYAQLAAACLTTCFILSQREAACRRIMDHGGEALRRELLPPLARGERFATVGLSHLTTSRQHLGPAVKARLAGDHFLVDGVLPWVTGAAQADHVVTGAVLEDGRQIMLVLPRHLEGVTVGPPLPLMALAGSITAEVHCTNVPVHRRWLLAGPAERVMTAGRGGTGGLETSCLALGLAGAAIDYLAHEAEARPDLRPWGERLANTHRSLREVMFRLAEAPGPAEAALTLRARANALVLRATQAALTAGKGSGFLLDHPAQRWARQALFFLVWSCPRPAAEATLAYLTPADGPECDGP